MRIKRKAKPRLGAKRIISKFLILPKTLDNETRFLERGLILQTFGLSGWYDVSWKN